MSEYVVHFTRDGGKHKTAYDNIQDILYSGHLEPGEKTFGTAKNFGWLGNMRRAVCLSEVPIQHARRLVKRHRSRYGVGFKQKFIAERHGARVWYLDVGSTQEAVWLDLQAQKARERDSEDGFWGLATCVDRVGETEAWRHEFEWEREWRVVGPVGLHFEPSDVEFLFIPEEWQAAAAAFYDDFFGDLGGPGFTCPMVDPLWEPDRILELMTPSS
jgi:hypothetical protein